MTTASPSSRSLATWIASFFATGLIFLVGAGGMAFLMLALNGFSERQAAPIFLGYLLGLSGFNALMVALLTRAIVGGTAEAGARRRLMWLNAAVFTALPFLAGVAFFASGGSI